MTFLVGASTLWSLCLLAAMTGPAESVVSEYTQCCDCQTLMPTNIRGNALPQSRITPFKITVGAEEYRANQSVTLSLTSTNGESFRSFMLVATTKGSATTGIPRGQFFVQEDTNYKIKPDCIHKENSMTSFAVTSTSKVPVQELNLIWFPLDNYGNIEFRATFINDDTTYWTPVKSPVINDMKQVYIPPINTLSCGKTKGCYRVPEDCAGPQCLFVLTWKDNVDSIDFELGGLTDGSANSYIAAALSDDTYVGDDLIFVCAHDVDTDKTGFYHGRLDDGYETKIVTKYSSQRDDGSYDLLYGADLIKEQGAYYNNLMHCRFTLRNKFKGYKLRHMKKHVIMSRGSASNGQPDRMGVGYSDFPRSSEDKISFTSNSDSSGKASYPLVKAHGCLMIIAWVLFSSVGFLLAKYYQSMWPEKRMYSRKYWFSGHFKCMSMVFILVVIAIILIFIEADGYTYAKNLPYRAHPILGIIIFVCVFLLPFIALLRPGKGHSCRNVFNWLYWIFATIANVLAIPNIFIGMNFGKSSVPWWATWILVFWVIFHIIVEITLEIHQCMMHKKNKERRKKHELLKRDYPKQHHPMPEPAGRQFKRFMLMLHMAITILITLIMVIIIAVA